LRAMAHRAPCPDAPIILLGSGSRAGAALKAGLAGRTVTGICRRTSEGDLVVPDYDRIPAGAIPPGAILVNCLGQATGDPATMRRVNAELPLRWAEAAKAAGAGNVVSLSSFSVYGGAPRIGRDTPERPAGAYGESKLAGDRALLALADESFGVTLLRLPILIGAGDDKVSQLLRLLRRARFLPVPVQKVRRSMLAYADLPAVVAKVIDAPTRGVVHAADPEPFSYELVREAMAEAGQALRLPKAPAWLIGAARTVAPGIGRRLYEASLLDDEANLARDLALPVGLRRTLAAMVAEAGR